MRSRTQPAFRIGALVAALVATVATVTATSARDADAAEAGAYRTVRPTRVLDTREGLGAPRAAVGPDASIDVKVTGTAGVPSSGVGAVVFNLTGTNAGSPTFITASPTGSPREGSNLNLLPGQTDSNLVIASVGDGGRVNLYNRFGSVDLIADVAGWFPTGDTYHPLPPRRVADTRTSGGPVGPGAHVDLQVTGVGGVPASGVGAVVLNVTGTNPTASTFVATYPSGGTRDGSNLNLVAGQTDSSLVIATVGDGGRVALYNRFGAVDLVVDVAGWFPAGASYAPLSPTRVLDTRAGVGAPQAPVGEDRHIDVKVTGVGGVPASGVGAVVVNVTATNPTTPTYVSAYPSGTRREGSIINLMPWQTTSNLVVAAVGADGRIALYNRFGTTDLVADVTGWFPGTPQSAGTLWATGIGRLWRLDLAATDGRWEERGNYDEAATVDLPRNRWVEADTDPYQPLIFRMRDLATNAVIESFEVESAAWSVDDISVSPDGRYLAMVANVGSLDTWIEVVDLTTSTSKDFGWDAVAREVEFAPNGELLVFLDDTYEEAYAGWASAIGVITRAQLDAGDAPEIGIIQAFDDADGRPGCIRVGPSLEITYGLNAALHVREPAAAPVALTTSGSGAAHSCGVFSPDGARIAFVQLSVAAGYQRQYVIPNHRGAPIYVDPPSGAGDEYLIGVDNTVGEIIAWQP